MTRKYIKKDTRKYWYKYYEEECVLCGNYSVIKERQYSEKPLDSSGNVDYMKTHSFSQYLCSNHY